MNIEFWRLAETIREKSKGKPILFVVNPGNWGDALIRAGSIEFFNHFNIPFEELLLRDKSGLKRNWRLLKAKLKGQLVVISGGGAWCGHYSHLSKSVQGIQNRFSFDNILVLPSTYEKPFDIKNVCFFRRDKFQSKEAMPGATFCHDMAFFLPRYKIAPNCSTKEQSQFFRTDVESSNKITLTPDNRDLSAEGTELDPIAPFFEALTEYKVINTDRLHVSIGASLLGLEVNLREGSYFKNQAIYKSSLNEYFPKNKICGK